MQDAPLLLNTASLEDDDHPERVPPPIVDIAPPDRQRVPSAARSLHAAGRHVCDPEAFDYHAGGNFYVPHTHGFAGHGFVADDVGRIAAADGAWGWEIEVGG
jgi:hypothetical protein